jgi:aminopeptidase N
MPKCSIPLILTLALFLLLAAACNYPTGPLPALQTPGQPTGLAPSLTAGAGGATLTPPGSSPTSSQAQAAPSTLGSAGGGDPYYPQLGNGGYDAARYTIDLAVDMDARSLRGSTSMQASATQDLSRFDLDFSGPDVSGVTIDGKAAAFTRQGSELVVTPPGLLAKGQAFTCAVSYAGKPGAELDPNTPVYSRGWINYDQGVLVAAEPSGQSSWYPVNETPADKAAYTFRITVAKPWVVVANGLQKSVTDNGATRTYLYATDNPLAPYLVTLGIDEFTSETDSSGDVPVRNYFGAGYPAGAKAGFARTPQIISYYESLFGKFPFEAYGVVGHNTRLPFALEAQTLTVFGNSFTDEQVAAHELAHSWFGDSVTLARWQDIWLNEGFASFGARMWQEHSAGKDASSKAIRDLYAGLVRAESQNILLGDPGPKNDFSTLIYNRGEMTLTALRARLGDGPFFKILQTYAQHFYHSNATTQDFIATAEQVSGKDLADFFHSWLFQVRLPDIPELGLLHP